LVFKQRDRKIRKRKIGGELMEEIRQALEVLKRECSSHDKCEDGECKILKLLPSLDICPLYQNNPEEWKIEERGR
jgi:hypothetical protein